MGARFCVSYAMLLFVGGVASMISLERPPSNVTVLVGQDALFTCRVIHQGRTDVIWMGGTRGNIISNNGQVVPGSSPAAGQYLIEGDPRLGDYHLKITQVQVADAGLYHCGYNSGMAFVSAGAYLTVLVAPSEGYPECHSQPDVRNLAVGDTTELVCLSNGGIPPAELVWSKDGVDLTPAREHTNSHLRVLELSDRNARFQCRASSPAITQQRACTVSTQLPDPVVTIQPDATLKVDVGENVTLLCNRQDKPNEDRFTWFFGDVQITAEAFPRIGIYDSNRALTITNVREEDHGFYKCAVTVHRILDISATRLLQVRIMTGETLGTLAPPRLRTVLPPDVESSSQGGRLPQDVSTAGMSVSNGNPSRDYTAVIIILGAAGGLIVVISVVVIKFMFVRRQKQAQKEKDHQQKHQQHPPQHHHQKPGRPNSSRSGSGISLMTTRNSERSLSSFDSVNTTRTSLTTSSKLEVNSNIGDGSKSNGSHYAELDSHGLRSSDYQGLNAPPKTIYAEPIIAPTRLVPRPQHQDGFHDYAFPDIIPELATPQEYVEPDPPPRNTQVKQPEQKQQKQQQRPQQLQKQKQQKHPRKPNLKPAPKPPKTPEKKELSQQNADGVYIEIIA